MKTTFFGYITLITLIFSASVFAYGLVKQPIEVQIKKAEYIVIGKVIDIKYEKAGQWEYQYAEIEPIQSLLTEIPPQIKLALKGGYTEANLQCCEKGSLHLFFLTKGDSPLMHAVNGRHSDFKVISDRVIGWEHSENNNTEAVIKQILKIRNTPKDRVTKD
ncbi:MAG: hypothetical protein HRT35_00195 [Algicola sp.]|nr:hypothetical protein [Algicola sp.]